MDEQLSFKNSSGDDIAGIISIPENPRGKGIILLHCFTCTKHHRIMRMLASGLSERGFTVLRIDFSGNGESGGKIEDATYTKMIGEVKVAVSLLLSRGVKEVGVAGHSMGAMLSLLSGQNDPRIKAVGFIAGSSQAARVREVFPKDAVEKAEKEGEAESAAYGRPMKLRREFLLDVETYNMGHAAATLGRPILIIHGTADETIPLYHARQLYNWCTEPKKLEILNGADHLFKDDAQLKKMVKAAADWFEKNL